MKQSLFRGIAVGLLLFAGIGAAQATPEIYANSIVNAGSYIGLKFPNSGVARGGMFILTGKPSTLGACGVTQVSSLPLQTSMGGTSIKVTVGGTSVDAFMIYVVACRGSVPPDQLAAVLPSNTPLGTGTVTVSYNGRTSAPEEILVINHGVGLFTLNQGGSGPAVIQNVVSATELPVNTLLNPARSGQAVIAWGTGMGADGNPDENLPMLPKVEFDIKVWVGGKLATLIYAGRSGCCAGIDQIAFYVPEGVEGCFVPIAVQMGNHISNYASLSVAESGTCNDPGGISAADLQLTQQKDGFRFGYITLGRYNVLTFLGGQSFGLIGDEGSATFGEASLAQLLGLPSIYNVSSAGSCSAFHPADADDDLPALPLAIDVGPAIDVSGPKGTMEMLRFETGIYGATLGSGVIFDIPGFPLPDTLFLNPGAFTVSNRAGSDLGGRFFAGPFQSQITLPEGLDWTNRAEFDSWNRTDPLTVTWTGGGSGMVEISGYSLGLGFGAGREATGVFHCLENASAGQFTIPPSVLLTLPRSLTVEQAANAGGQLSVGIRGDAVRFNATGLDVGWLDYVVTTSRNVEYK